MGMMQSKASVAGIMRAAGRASAQFETHLDIRDDEEEEDDVARPLIRTLGSAEESNE